jgi:hypothetical protein
VGDKQVDDVPQRVGETYDLDTTSTIDQEVAAAVQKGEGEETQRTPRQIQLQQLANRSGTMNRPGNLDDINESDLIVGDGGQTILLRERGIETHASDPNDPGIKIDGMDGSEFRTGGQPLERDTTADKDIYADGKTRNRKEAYGANHIVDPYKPMLNTAPMWVRGLVRGVIIAIRVLDEAMGDD